MQRLIDADKAKEVLKKLLYETAMNNSGGASLMCEDIAENRLESWFGLVPTVDAEPVRHGHWITQFDDLFPMESTIECSACGEKEWMMTITNHNYCPNCGAKMDGERKEDETD